LLFTERRSTTAPAQASPSGEREVSNEEFAFVNRLWGAYMIEKGTPIELMDGSSEELAAWVRRFHDHGIDGLRNLESGKWSTVPPGRPN